MSYPGEDIKFNLVFMYFATALNRWRLLGGSGARGCWSSEGDSVCRPTIIQYMRKRGQRPIGEERIVFRYGEIPN
jgi:hypothetical protein